MTLLAVLSWGTMLYGATLSAALALLLAVCLRERRSGVLVCALLATFAAPVGWNAILRATHATNFFTDAPIAVFPASWQDFGSGVFTLAATSALLGAGPLSRVAGRRAVALAAACGLAAFVVDIYLY